MELLLNVFWLALALPAILIWRRVPLSAHGRQISLLRSILILGFLLLLLFPVISATDDLHALRPDIEESNPRRVAQQSTGHLAGAFSAAGPFVAQIPVSLPSFGPDQLLGRVSTSPAPPVQRMCVHERTSRPPPFFPSDLA